MSKKTIGLNPLEEYLSAHKRSTKGASKALEKVSQEEQKVVAASPEPSVEKVVMSPLKDEVDFSEEVEVDLQGQLAIKGTRVPEDKVLRSNKQRITLHISTELIDRVKNAVYWEPGLTVAGFAEDAFSLAIENLEKERGAPFPQRKQHRLRGGRPVS